MSMTSQNECRAIGMRLAESWRHVSSIRYLFLFLFTVLIGCANQSGLHVAPTDLANSIGDYRKTGNVLRSRARSRAVAPVPAWEWSFAMPVGGTRAELIAATLPGLVLADLVHTNSGMTGPIRQAIAELPQASLQIKNVGGHEVRTCADLYRALDALANNDGVVQVDFVEPNASASSPGFAVALDANSLRTIGREVAPESGAIRAVQGGNPCIVMRTNDCTCTVAARVERQLGLLQVVATINAGSDCNLPLPLDIRAWCDGVALRCLTSAESLNLLYGDRSLQNGTADDAACSFSAVSDREDYLLPTNFKRLSESLAGKQGPAQVPSEPALVSVPGADYPGSPILADARALAGFLLRRQIYQANSETTGWVIFGANQIRNGDSVEIAIDLGAGPERFKFRIPAEPARAR